MNVEPDKKSNLTERYCDSEYFFAVLFLWYSDFLFGDEYEEIGPKVNKEP